MTGSLPAMVAAAALETSQALGSPIAWGFVAAALIFGGIFFMVAIVKAFTRQTTGWIVAAVVSGIIALIGLFGAISLSAKAATKLVKAKREEGLRKKRMASADGKVRLEVPGTWKEMPELNEDASIRAGDEIRNQYVIVIRNPKMDFDATLSEFEDSASGIMMANLQKVETAEPEEIHIGELPAIRRRFTAVTRNVRLVYYSTAVETSKAFYQVLIWTLPSRETEAKEVFDGIINSFTSDEGPPVPGNMGREPKMEAGDIHGRIRRIVVEQLGLKPDLVTPEARLVEDLGADSLDFVELVMATEEEFGISIPDEEAEKIRTIGELLRYIEAQTAAPAEKE